MHRPNAAGTDAGADAASDAPIGIGNIPIRAARQCFPADGPLRAGFQAHSAIPAGPATDTTVKIPVRGRQEEVMLAEPTINMTAVYGSACSIKPEVLLDDGQIFEAAGFSIQMFHTPGHTKGSCCYYIKDEGVLFSGDTLFCGSVGRTDFPGGSSAEIVRSLHKLVDTLPEDTEVFPGHDASTTIGYEKRYNPFV